MSQQVQSMFSQIAPRYDAANDVLSLGVHRYWRTQAVKRSQARAGDKVLDCATGTGDLAIAFKKTVGDSGQVKGTDFCADMLKFAPEKAAREGLQISFEVADAMALPYPAQSFDVTSIAFGIRNVDAPQVCLKELARVLKPGGRAVVLEFGQPDGLYGALFRFYSRHVMPLLGAIVTGNRAAYEYLPRTSAAFPAGERFVTMMKDTGAFRSVEAHSLLFGTAWVYVGRV
ncbi:MAG: bifunctional demethylmenaquinone methyltransferase/2-methoxy-6-polyprenyl-1,4-benzoquinol methylase UbiE [Myxococcaceae bacterium]|nr:bifunctional demethylmenaquinone methyltransferase/2-methoxy-6-polyprenyl-1,4-benzoquinol methylase UbiE [Myxococcaceae bacterium]